MNDTFFINNFLLCPKTTLEEGTRICLVGQEKVFFFIRKMALFGCFYWFLINSTYGVLINEGFSC